MAYLAATALTEYRQQYSSASLDKFENRGTGLGLLSLAKRDTPNLISTAEIIKARGTAERATKVQVLQKIAFSNTSVRTCTGATQSSVSALVTLSWVTIANGFHMVPSQYNNNDIAYVEDFKHKMQQMELAMAKEMDTAIYTKLNAVKSTTFTAENAPFAFSSSVVQIPQASKPTYLSELYQSMFQDDFVGPFNIVASPALMSVNQYFANQGAGNSANTVFQFGDFSFDYSNRVALSGGANATFFIMPNGSIGILDWIDPESRRGARLSESNYWTTATLPMIGVTSGLHVQATCADNTTEGGAGLEASVIENFNFSFDYALVSPYISAGASPIYKADILSL
ncbi:MAG: hypothetical protein M0P47_09190 [Bacteroidales bacterium]|nr:hypothetical protein [Bacteroidales bacterium]